jgi:hypothetical protein
MQNTSFSNLNVFMMNQTSYLNENERKREIHHVYLLSSARS